MTASQPIRLGVLVNPSGGHAAAWRRHADPARLLTDAERYVTIARIAERGPLDTLLIADTAHGRLPAASASRTWRSLDPIGLLTYISAATRHVGLVATTTALFGHPLTVARQVITLDQISGGRAGWNAVTSQSLHTL